MSEPDYVRKLAAILYADVAGYSRLTGQDEVGTHRRLAERLGLIAELVRNAGGRVVHYAGELPNQTMCEPTTMHRAPNLRFSERLRFSDTPLRSPAPG